MIRSEIYYFYGNHKEWRETCKGILGTEKRGKVENQEREKEKKGGGASNPGGGGAGSSRECCVCCSSLIRESLYGSKNIVKVGCNI